MTEHEAAVDDALSKAIRRATRALIDNDLKEAWQALDAAQAARMLREWDRIRGREVLSEAQLQANQDALMADLRSSLRRQRPWQIG
jgi:hypothetical protein